MNLTASIIGIIVLIVLILIGYKISQMVIELNSPITPKVNSNLFTLPKEESRNIFLRWNHFPLSIYIETSFIEKKPEYISSFNQALKNWEVETNNLVSFSLAEDPSNADIIVKWVPNLKEKSTDALGNADLKYVSVSVVGIIQNTGIELLTKSGTKSLNAIDMTNLAMHEIGHSLGLNHSTEESDIMYPVLTIPSRSIKEISISDKENLRKIYELPTKPDLKIIGANATKFTFSQFGQNYFYLNISIDVQNIGLVDVETFKIQLGADKIFVKENEHSKLEPGSVLNIYQGNINIARNYTSVQISIDPYNLIDELNETNNYADINVN